MLMQLLEQFEQDIESYVGKISGFTKNQIGKLIFHAFEFEYIESPHYTYTDGDERTLKAIPLREVTLTPRGKRYLSHLQQEFQVE